MLGIEIEELIYNNLKALIETNFGPYVCYKPRKNQDQEEIDPHFRTTLRELYLNGSKLFRKVSRVF